MENKIISKTKKNIAITILTFVTLVAGIIGVNTLAYDSVLVGNLGTVTISNSGTSLDYYDVDASQATIQCLKITGSYVDVTGATVTGCNSHGVLITGKNVIFENGTVYHNVTENGTVKCSGSGSWGSGIKVALGGENSIIRNNKSYENCGEGIAVTRGIVAEVKNNIVWDNFAANIYIDNSYTVTVTGNHSSCQNPNYYRSGAPANGILLGNESYLGWGSKLKDVLIDNNTIERCKGVRLWNPINGVITGIVISNNNFLNVATPFVSVQGATVINNVSLTRTPSMMPTVFTSTPSFTPSPSRTVTPIETSSLATKTLTLSPTITMTTTPTLTCILYPSYEICSRPR